MPAPVRSTAITACRRTPKRARTSSACSTLTGTTDPATRGDEPAAHDDDADSTRTAAPRAHTLMRLPILDNYMLHEMFSPFMFAFGAFLLFWALNIFFLAADYIINQHAPFFLVLRFVVFRIPQAIPMAFPFACLFASLLAMGRLMGDNEVTALRTAGIPVMRIALAAALRRPHVPDRLRHE